MPEDLNENDALYSPYLAAIEGRDASSRQRFFERFAQQPREIRQFITSTDTIKEVKRLVESGIVPAQYGVAVAKIIALLAIDEIQTAQILDLLQKLGLSEDQSTAIEQSVLVMIEPVVSARAKRALPAQMPTLPPLTMKIPPIPPAPAAPDSSKTPARNIIDLRKQEPTS